MANGVTIEIQGLDKLQKQLGKFPVALENEVDAELAAASNHFVNLAVASATKSVDTGFLRNGISFKREGKMHYEVVSAAGYSAYVEWGTITFVKVPAELSAYAMQFKGKGIRKTGGMLPSAFFFVQMPIIEKELNVNLNKAVARVL